MNDGGSARGQRVKCAWCGEDAYAIQGHLWLCSKHYRFQQMRVNAKRKGKPVPSYEDLENLLEDTLMVCAGCGREMNWHSWAGKDTVISLQHDRDGRIRFLCRSCNTRHAFCEGDSFYILPNGYSYCPKCKTTKPFSDFYHDKRKFNGYKTWCKSCTAEHQRNYRNKNRESYNAKAREYRRKRAGAGYPVTC